MYMKSTALKKKIFLMLFTFLSVGNNLFSQDIQLNVYVDRNVVQLDQQFVLTIKISGGDSQRVALPNPPDLSSFANYLGSDTSQSFQIINGRMSSSKSMNCYYLAGVEGEYQVPSISINYGGKTYKSNSINIKVVKDSQQGVTTPRGVPPIGGEGIVEEVSGENVYLQAEVDKKEIYVNQPVMVNYKLYTRVHVTGYNVVKIPALVGFWSEEFEMPKQIVTYERVINGKKYVIAELKKLAIFPTESGEKQIDPMELELEVRIMEKKKFRSPFDSFFDDNFFFGRTTRVKVESKPILIRVKPLPQDEKPQEFTGAVGNYVMNVSVDKEEVNLNDAVSLKVKIEGSGNLKILQEPKIEIPSDFEKYEPKINLVVNRSGNIIKGYKEFEYVLIPRLVGKYEIKSIKYAYFDPNKGIYKVLTSPVFLINVKAGRGYKQITMKGLSKEEIRVLGRDIRFIKIGNPKFTKIGDYLYKRPTFKVILILPIIGLMVAIYYRHKMTMFAENVAYARSRKASQIAKKRLNLAKKMMKVEKQKEFYAELSGAIIGYIADKLNLSAAGIIIDEVAEKLRQNSVDPQVIDLMMEILRKCDYQRFASANSKLDEMELIYEKAKAVIIKFENIKQ